MNIFYGKFNISIKKRIYGSLVILLSIILISSSLYFFMYNKDGTSRHENGFDYDYYEYYNFSGLGKNWAFSVDLPVYLDEDDIIPKKPNHLYVYHYDPINIEDVQNAQEFIEGYNFSIASHSLRIGTTEYYQIKPIIFENETETIVIYNHGNFQVQYNTSRCPTINGSFTEDDARKIAEHYLEAHTGIPDNVYTIKYTHSGEDFFIRYIQELDGFPVYNTAKQNQILFFINRSKGVVDRFEYHWPELVKMDKFDQEDIASPETCVENFINAHNDQMENNKNASIREIGYYYAAVFGFSRYENLLGSPYYIYLPYIRILWDTGETYISPIITES